MVNELPAEKMRRECASNLIRCETTQGLMPLQEIIDSRLTSRDPLRECISCGHRRRRNQDHCPARDDGCEPKDVPGEREIHHHERRVPRRQRARRHQFPGPINITRRRNVIPCLVPEVRKSKQGGMGGDKREESPADDCQSPNTGTHLC